MVTVISKSDKNLIRNVNFSACITMCMDIYTSIYIYMHVLVIT